MKIPRFSWLGKLRKFILPTIGGGIGALCIGIGAYAVIEATDSSAFCGNACHEPMYPEYTTYQASPHSTVPCASCHVGSGVYNLIDSKLKGVPQITQTITGSYDRPITSPVENLRPPRETCEKCHTPQKFSGDMVRTINSYKSDESNTRQTTTVVLSVGGGKPGYAEGIHSHIVSKVWYVPMDEQRLEIGWVGVEKPGGELETYINPADAAGITEEFIQKGKRLMDCVDCHNRATHQFLSPEELIDKALQDGSIDDSLQFIKRESVRAFSVPARNLDEAYNSVSAVEDFYKNNYPDVYTNQRQLVDAAVEKLKEIARLTTFPDMKVDWNTHADQSGHNKPPDEALSGWNSDFTNWKNNKSQGCFRCHGILVPQSDSSNEDSEPLTVSTKKAGIESNKKGVLDASCNLCHYSLQAQPGSPIPKAVPHPEKGLENCMLCHGSSSSKPFPEDHPWSTNDVCIACHQSDTTVKPIPVSLNPGSKKETPHTLSGLDDCLLCHSETGSKPIKNDHPWTTNENCTDCHKTAPVPKPIPEPSPVPASVPEIPHVIGGLEDCMRCHGSSAPLPITERHPWSTNETCQACHTASATPPPVPTAAPNNAPAIMHSTQGLESCRSCHGSVVSIPSSHALISNDFCTLCHNKIIPYYAPAAAPPNTPGGGSPPPSSTPVVPVIPHTLAGRDDCLSCHVTGGTPSLPVTHAGRTNDTCTLCHRPGVTPNPSPSVTTGSASSITTSSAMLSGNLDSLGTASSVTVSFQWGTISGSYTGETTTQSLSAAGSFNATLTGLSANTIYYFRAKAVGNATAFGAENSFTAAQTTAGPTVATGSASSITTSSATLSGSLSSLGSTSPVIVSFQWGINPGSYSGETTTQSRSGAGTFNATLTGLSTNTQYYFRARAVGSTTAYGAESSFTTSQAAVGPTVTTGNASSITASSATLSGNLSSLGSASPVIVSFQWGTNPGSYSGETTPHSMSTTGSFNTSLTGLSPNTLYYFRAKAVGSATVYGTGGSFTTQQAASGPAVTTGNASSITSSAATLSGSLDSLGSASSVAVSFQWGTSPGGTYPNETAPSTLGTPATRQSRITSLSPATTYYFRIKAVGASTVYGSEKSFTTAP